VLRRKVRIADSHFDALVAHKLLHGAKVNSCHDQLAGERIAEAMPGKPPNLRLWQRRQALADATLGTPASPASASVPRAGFSGPPKENETPNEEILRLTRELAGKSEPKQQSRKSELTELPTCRSLL
jgi:hypothetical protein